MSGRLARWGLVPAAALVLAGCGAAHRASVQTFTGHWWGHTRGLDITSGGRGREYVKTAGVARPLIVRFEIVRVYGTAQDAIARVRVTSVEGPRAILEHAHRPHLHAHDGGSLLLKHGVVADGLTGISYCAPHVDKCGL